VFEAGERERDRKKGIREGLLGLRAR